MNEVKEEAKKPTTEEKIELILKAAECEYNYLWRCKHPSQWGMTCKKVCEFYKQ